MPPTQRWLTSSDVARDLGLRPTLDSDSLRLEIRQQVAEIHPDRHGGVFESAQAQQRYQLLTEAMEFLDQPRSTALVPIQEIPALVAAMRQALVSVAEPAQTPAQVRAAFRGAARTEIRGQLLLPRIGSGAFAALCGFLLSQDGESFLIPDEWVSEMPAATTILNTGTVICFVVFALFFVFTWWDEQRALVRLEWLSSEGGRSYIFNHLMLMGGSEAAEPAPRRFSFTHNLGVIRGGNPSDKPSHNLSALGRFRRAVATRLAGRLTIGTAERLAKVHLEELEARGVVRKLPLDKRLDTVYEFDSEVR